MAVELIQEDLLSLIWNHFFEVFDDRLGRKFALVVENHIDWLECDLLEIEFVPNLIFYLFKRFLSRRESTSSRYMKM